MKTLHGNHSTERAPAGMPSARVLYFAGVALAILSLAPPAAAQQAVEVRAVVESDEVYLGKSFFFQIQVLGGTQVQPPDVSMFHDFDVREIPQSWIADRLSNRLLKFNLQDGTSFLYRLIALKPGPASIPSVAIDVDADMYDSPAVRIRVLEPPPSKDFMLWLSLAKKQVYVGEPVVLKGVWYSRKTARFYSAIIPILRHPGFNPDAASSGSARFVRSFTDLQNWQGRESATMIDGILYTTVSFERVLVPKDAGRFDFPPATVQMWGVGENDPSPEQGYSGRWNYNSIVIGSHALSIRVLPLPVEGRPANFSGLVAENVSLSAAVTPSEMNVGDPVTLSLMLSGPPSVEEAELPPLGSLAGLAGNFTLRSEPMSTRIEGRLKTFSTTIRVKSEAVREVPSLEIPYFNTRSGSYQLARSKPFPITVRPTRIVTASDLEGMDAGAVSSTSVRTWEEGILFNYGGAAQLLDNQPYGVISLASNPAVPVLLAVPLCFLLAVLLLVSRRRAQERRLDLAEMASALSAVSSYQRLAQRLDRIDNQGHEGAEQALAAWREYLGAKLGLQPGRLTWQEMENELRRQGIGEELLLQIRELLSRYELHSYSGNSERGRAEEQSFIAQIARVASELDRRLS